MTPRQKKEQPHESAREEDPSLDELARGNVIARPIVIVEQRDDGSQLHRVFIDELGPLGTEPKCFGFALSDLIDQIAWTYHKSTGREERDIRREIAKVMRYEDQRKDNDPNSGMRATFVPILN